MSRHAPLATTATLTAAVLMVLALGAPAPAAAGIGNPLKKAKEAVEKAEHKEAPKSDAQAKPCTPPAFDDVTVELTEALLARMIATYQKMETIMAPRAGLLEKRTKAMDERGAIWDKHGEKIMALRQKREDVKGCYHDGYQVAQQRRAEEYAQRALSGDPQLLEKYKNLAMRDNAAAAAGDSAAQARLQAGLHEEYLPTHDDSVQVRQSCGPIPPKSKEEDQVEALDKQIASLEEKIRQIEQNAAETQAKDLGLSPAQMGQALERIRMFGLAAKPAASGSGSTGSSSRCGYTDEEAKAIEKHGKELGKYLN